MIDVVAFARVRRASQARSRTRGRWGNLKAAVIIAMHRSVRFDIFQIRVCPTLVFLLVMLGLTCSELQMRPFAQGLLFYGAVWSEGSSGGPSEGEIGLDV